MPSALPWKNMIIVVTGERFDALKNLDGAGRKRHDVFAACFHAGGWRGSMLS